MTWFDIKQLERDLIEDRVSEKEVFNYFLTSSLVTAIVPFLSENDTPNKILTSIELVFGIILTIVLLKATFNINSDGDKKDYLKRFVCLSLVSFIRLLVFALVPILVFTVTLKIIEAMNIITFDDIEGVFLLSLTICFGIGYYFMLTNSFKRVSLGK
jgi:hypothetical protein